MREKGRKDQERERREGLKRFLACVRACARAREAMLTSVAVSATRASTARTGEPVDMNLLLIDTAIIGSHHGDKGRDA